MVPSNSSIMCFNLNCQIPKEKGGLSLILLVDSVIGFDGYRHMNEECNFFNLCLATSIVSNCLFVMRMSRLI